MDPPLGQLGVPCEQTTELLPVCIVLKIVAEIVGAVTLARPYKVGPMLPRAPVPRCCSTRARMPASDGATNEVPPKTLAWPLEARKPLVQDPWLQTTYPSCCAAALSETSRTPRAESLGTPTPVCQAGLEKKPLAPPPPEPPASRPPEGVVSFQGCSGI